MSTTTDDKKSAALVRAEDKVEAGKDLTPTEQRALDDARAEQDEMRGYTEFKYHGVTMYRSTEHQERTFDTEREAQEWVAKTRVARNLSAGVGG